MIHVRSKLAGGPDSAHDVAAEWLPRFANDFPVKLYWFLSKGYRPHPFQAVFHASAGDYDGVRRLVRMRHLVAGRRGGKTLSAAWEVLFYVLHPKEFHRDAHGRESERPLWVYLLAKDHKLGRPQLFAFLEAIAQAKLVKGKDYDYNKTEKIFTFFAPDGTVTATVEIRSADDPQSLRGSGLDIIWIDEAAMLPSDETWGVVRPNLSEKLGLLITTTTPKGRNWFYEEFWSDISLADRNQGRVEYTSVDNPYFPREEWDYAREHMHPVMFAQEYMASFDAMTGLTLLGQWLHYFSFGKPDDQNDEIGIPKDRDGKLALRTFIGVDPAISLHDDADDFAMVLLGLTKDNTQAFLLDLYVDKIPFPDQLDKIHEWFLKYRPEAIGVEAIAYQQSLSQMAARLEGLPPIIPVFSKGKKNDRIIAMSPLFKIGKVRIHRTKYPEFIHQWINFDGAKKNQHDDILDATEIALGVAGVLLPTMSQHANHFTDRRLTPRDEAHQQILAARGKSGIVHDVLGEEA